MASTSIYQLKETECPGTPLFLFDCTLADGSVQRFSTHAVAWNGNGYSARVLDHNAFEFRSSIDDSGNNASNLRLLLADADAEMSEIERNVGWKGARVVVTFLFFDLAAGAAASDGIVVFRGMANPMDEATETTLRLSFVNRLNLQRSYLPTVRIQRRCPWAFPTTDAQMNEAVNGGAAGKWSPFYSCGYSAGLAGGCGNLNGSEAFHDCDRSRANCEQRGMFDKDSAGQVTRRFGGIEFVPPAITVRSYGEKGHHLSPVVDNLALYNDGVPLVYGTGWYQPPVVFARNDGNLTRMEVLLGSGEIDGVDKVVVNNVELPAGQAGVNMTGTGWYSQISTGTRDGAFNSDFSSSAGAPLGDPYGSMAFLSVVVPNRISDGQTLPQVDVLIRGLKLARYDASGNPTDTVLTNNPAWVLLDVLKRAGWDATEIDIASFARAAAKCDELIPATDLNGNPMLLARYQCNFIVTRRRSVSDLARGIGNCAGILLAMGSNGLLAAVLQNTLAAQQSTKPPGSNSIEPLLDGWPAYEFGDTVFSGIVRGSDGSISLRVSSQPLAETPNRFTVEFQDQFNEYQQDSLSLSDLDDVLLTRQELTVSLQALGIPNFNQAGRMLARALNRAVNGNTFVQFETSVRGAGLKPGDIITLTYAREAWERQPFRITSMAPAMNHRTAVMSAQIHDDAWYGDTARVAQPAGRRQSAAGTGIPSPLAGTVVNADGSVDYGIVEQQQEQSDGTANTLLRVTFEPPNKPGASAAAIPLIGLAPLIDTTQGTLPGGATFYYGVSAIDAEGGETALSFLVTAAIPSGGNENSVTLLNLSFSRAATFNVYRGTTPQTLRLMAPAVALSSTFVDSGAVGTSTPPPDQNYDHANFYWRMETQPAVQSDQFSATTIGSTTLEMPENGYIGMSVRITKGAGAGQERLIAANTQQTITLASPWAIVPEATSEFTVAEAGWSLAGTTTSNQLVFLVPTRPGSTVEICGRAANVYNQECCFEESPVSRWQIGVGGSGVTDADIPPAPEYTIAANGHGGVEVSGITFPTLVNTATITAGTLTLYYWSELNGAAGMTLAGAMDGVATGCFLAGGAQVAADDVLEVEGEILLVSRIGEDGTVTVDRGVLSSSVATHGSGAPVYTLARRTGVMPFPKRFFGSPASAAYAYGIDLPSARVAAAEFFMTNRVGDGGVQSKCFSSATSNGMRTLAGGQFCFQVSGILAVQNNAAPKVTADRARSIGAVLATVNVAPTGGDVVVAVTQSDVEVCRLTIANGTPASAPLDGAQLGVLAAGAALNINIVAVPTGVDAMPGQDLTVTIMV